MKSICALVVTNNRLQLLKETVESIRKQTETNYQLVVVNNGSTDGTEQWLQQQGDIITITQENSGGAGGFFTGLKYAAENGFDYCWLMDDDVYCEPEALQELAISYEKKPNIGFVCSLVWGLDGRPMNVPIIATNSQRDGYPDSLELLPMQMVKVWSATFVSVFLSTKIVREVGLPLHELFIWGDDTEYTTRISTRYPCYVCGKSLVVHKRAQQQPLSFESETDPNRIRMHFYSLRNQNYKRYQSLSWVKKLIFRLKWRKLSRYYKSIGQIEKAEVVLKVLKALPYFGPQIQYPICNQK